MVIIYPFVSRYQPPIPEDQVRPSNNFDNDGGTVYTITYDVTLSTKLQVKMCPVYV